ncbi:MAG TPA: hypothetical protein PLF26_09280 [Blastocatellia bacterium]|nr:hypothetical protein [Blastocatellia bacterium]
MRVSVSTAIAIAAGLVIASTAIGQERSIKRSQLPAAVEKTVAANAANARVRGFSEEKENGQTFYEAEFVVDGHSRDILMDPDGNIVEIEEQVPLDKLPANVRAGIVAQAGKGKITSVESITKHDAIVAYEAHILTGKKHTEIQVGPDGKKLDHEE